VALQALTFSKENAKAIGSRGGVSSLFEILVWQSLGVGGDFGVTVWVLLYNDFDERFAVFERAIVLCFGSVACVTEGMAASVCDGEDERTREKKKKWIKKQNEKVKINILMI